MMPTRLAVAAPPVLLAVVAATQMGLALYGNLSPWKGGGFGMFASVDGTPFRSVRIFVSAPDRSAELEVPPSLEDLAARAATFPSGRALDALARRVLDRERRHGRPAEAVRVEVWRTDFSRALDATHGRLGVLTVSVRDGLVAPPR
jgi:hypothetical protein